MTANYNKLGIEFTYPKGWALSDEEDASLPHTISVHSSTGAFWSVTIDSPTEIPSQAALTVAEGISKEYEEVEMDGYSGRIVDQNVTGFELHFYCLDMLVISRIMSLNTEQFCITFVYQGECRDFDALGPVFDAISHSLLQSLS